MVLMLEVGGAVGREGRRAHQRQRRRSGQGCRQGFVGRCPVAMGAGLEQGANVKITLWNSAVWNDL